MSTFQGSKGTQYVLLMLVLVALVAFSGCKGSDGATGPAGPAGMSGPTGSTGPQGPHGTFSNNNCIDCHHMSDMAIAMGIPIRPRENGGASLVAGVTGNNTASFKAAPAGTPVGLTVVSSFPVSNEVTGATTTVNVTGVYWQYMDGLPSSITGGTVSSPTITVTLTTPVDYRAALVNLALNPGTSWDTNRYRVVPVNDTNMSLATESRYLLTVFGDDGNVYWDLIGVKASDNNVSTFAPVHTTGEPVVPINLPVLIAPSTDAVNTPGWTPNWSLSTSTTSTATLSSATDKYPYFTPTVSGRYVVTDLNTSATVTVYAGTWRGVLAGAPTGTDPLLPVNYDTTCTACHNATDNPLTAWSGSLTAAPDKFAPWSKTGHAKRFTQGLNNSGAAEPYNTTCFPCHTVGFSATAVNNNGFHDQSGYTDFVNNVINTATAPSDTRYSSAWANSTYNNGLMQRTNIQCEQCHGPQVGTGAHPGDAGVSVAGTRESLDANVCGLCHGAATHHTRYPQWKQSPTGHANYDLARQHGTDPSCAACHSAQGNLLYQKQLVGGNPLRTLPSASVTWTASTVQPQTCQVCHDPHNVGRESDDAYFTPEQVNNDAPTRLSLLMAAAGLNPGDTPKLPAGFRATGVGKGGQCIICHNTRNGASGSNTYLHEDNDPVFGALSAYGTPHTPAQADVLMGHNAYFVGSTGGDASTLRGAHSTLPNTCVTCHMEKSPPPYAWTENSHGTNHTFKADINICNDCHGVDTGLGPKLQMDTQSQLDQVLTAINGAIVSNATGTYAGNMAGASYNPGYLVTVTVGSNTYNVANVVPINTAAGQTLAKAIWNYNLIANDSSKGVHNPNFVRIVLGTTYEQLMALQ